MSERLREALERYDHDSPYIKAIEKGRSGTRAAGDEGRARVSPMDEPLTFRRATIMQFAAFFGVLGFIIGWLYGAIWGLS